MSGNSAWPPLTSSKKRRGGRGQWHGTPKIVNTTLRGANVGAATLVSVMLRSAWSSPIIRLTSASRPACAAALINTSCTSTSFGTSTRVSARRLGTRMPLRRAYQRQHAVAGVADRGTEPARHQYQDQQQSETRREQRPLRLGEEELEALHVDRAENRAADRTQAADHDHGEDAQAFVRVEVRRVERALLEDEQRPRDTGEESRCREREDE